MIQYLSRDKIDAIKWDRSIDMAENGLIYAYSFYLDQMAPHWDALVYNDYEAVMPLCWKRKYGIQYLYQPFLVAESGVFGKTVTEKMYEDFITAIPSKFKYINIPLNRGHISSIPSDYSLLRLNHLLDLNKSYEQIYSSYNENTQRNIKKAMQAGCTVQKDFSVEKVIELAVEQMKSHDKEITENIERFLKLYTLLHQKQMAITYGIFLEKIVLASAVFFYSHNRSYYILVGNNPAGRTTGASHSLIDAYIKDHAGKNLILDFEGSDIRSLAQFYKSFGATEIIYPQLKMNRLPFYLRWLKRGY
jgi:lipid II:glycine glycyltransferase (peptidoglycan interpeptide bridge formation enzyme)